MDEKVKVSARKKYTQKTYNFFQKALKSFRVKKIAQFRF